MSILRISGAVLCLALLGASGCADRPIAAVPTAEAPKPSLAGAVAKAKFAREAVCLSIDPAKSMALTVFEAEGADEAIRADATRAETYARAACALAETIDAVLAARSGVQ